MWHAPYSAHLHTTHGLALTAVSGSEEKVYEHVPPLDEAVAVATDLALRATKATAQAIGRSMASLVVLECHLWLNLTEIKDQDKTAFLDALVSSGQK
ncbi:MAG: hypothetical protein ACRCVK_18220 [Aeromonas veronii]